VDGTINEHAPDWPYVQLAAILRGQLAGMAPHQPLPSTARLCQEYGLSPKTVTKAVRLLRDEGLVYTLPSRGTFKAG
jgi:GntR family transcriptional regulator